MQRWFGALRLFRWRALPDFAGDIYDANIENNCDAVLRDAYINAYVRAGPRLASYRCALALGFLVVLPIIIPLLSR